MRRTSRTLIFLFAVALLVLFAAQGCSSRKKVSGGGEPPEAPSTSDNMPPSTETPPPPPSTSDTGGEDTQGAFRDAFFDYDEAGLREDAKAALDGDAKYMESHSGVKVVIEGHCDERGSVEYNLALGEKRARAAKDYLTTYGINAARITTISYGKERPFDPGHTEESWAQNRRAHFVSK
jgi:peptidoglycan-associated lipoprotein